MLQRVEIKNFQSHSDASFIFHNGVNVITGKSDVGKSAVVRALYWLSFNTPSGTDFVSYKTTNPCEVSVYFDNGNYVIKRRSIGDINEYISFDGKERRIFKALQGKVPVEVQNILRVDLHNFQKQYDKFFLVQDSAGEAAYKLNSVCGMGDMDDYVKHATQLLTTNKKQIDTLMERKDGLNEQLKRFVGLDKVLKELEDLVTLEKELEDNTKEGQEIVESLAVLKSTKNIEALKEQVIKIKEDIGVVEKLVKELDENEKIYDEIKNLSNFVISSNIGIKRKEEELVILKSQLSKLQVELKFCKECGKPL